MDAQTHTYTLLDTLTSSLRRGGATVRACRDQACVVRRRRLNTKQTPHQTRSKFIRVAGSTPPNPFSPEKSNSKCNVLFVRTRGNRKSTLKWRILKKNIYKWMTPFWCALQVVINSHTSVVTVGKNVSCVPSLAEWVRVDSECLSCDNRVRRVHVILVCHVCQWSLCGAACIMGGSGFIMGASLWLLARRQQPQMPLTGCWFSCWSLEVVAGGWAPALGLA